MHTETKYWHHIPCWQVKQHAAFLRETASKIQLLEPVMPPHLYSSFAFISLISRSSYGRGKNCQRALRTSTALPPSPILTRLLRVSLYSSILHFRDSTLQLKHGSVLLNQWSCQPPLCSKGIYIRKVVGSTLF